MGLELQPVALDALRVRPVGGDVLVLVADGGVLVAELGQPAVAPPLVAVDDGAGGDVLLDQPRQRRPRPVRLVAFPGPAPSRTCAGANDLKKTPVTPVTNLR